MTDAEAIIGSAIQSARYNEAVVVNVNNGDGDTSEIVLVACLDNENGGIVWKNANVCGDVATVAAATSNDTADTPNKEDIGIIRHLRTKRWVLPMLNDHRRNKLYDKAICDAVDKVVQRRIGSSDKEDEDSTIRILDIGSGTGLLAMMGARYTLDAIQEQQQQQVDSNTSCEQNMKVNVTGVEMASAMARLGRMTIEENDLSNHIKIVEQHSTDSTFQIDDSRFFVEDIKDKTKQHKADICTSELLESGLLGEGVLPAMRDTWTRHLKPDAIVVPKRARVYAVLVEGMPLNNDDDRQNCEATNLNAATAFLGPELQTFKASGGVWMSTTAQSTLDEEIKGTSQPNKGILLGSSEAEGKSSQDGINIPLHANAMLVENYNNDKEYRGIRPLSDPTMVLNFDFTSLDTLPPSTGRSVSKTIIPTTNGICHGVLFWWQLDLGDVDSTYSTEPIGFVEDEKMKSEEGESLWQDHWQQCLFVFGDAHANSNTDESTRRLNKGTPVDLIASHDDTSISFSISKTSSEENEKKSETSCTSESRPSQRRRLSEQGIESTMNRHITPTRALQLNDSSRIQTLTSSIRHCLAIKGMDSPVLDLSDFGLVGMIAAVSGATKVTSLESSSGALPTLAATVAQIGNSLPRAGADYQIIQALPEHIKVEHIAGGAAEIVVAEPFYEMLEGWHLQEALNYFYLICAMKKRGVISPTASSIPSCAKVMACVVEFKDFISAYGKVGDETGLVSGFRHDSVNHYGDRYHTYDVSLPLWQYRHKRLSKPFCIASIPYEGTTPSIDALCEPVKFISVGSAHAVIVWVDYKCRCGVSGGSDCFDTISTASSSYQQLVRKLHKPMIVTEIDVQNQTKYHYKASFGDDLTGIEDHSFTFEFHRKE